MIFVMQMREWCGHHDRVKGRKARKTPALLVFLRLSRLFRVNFKVLARQIFQYYPRSSFKIPSEIALKNSDEKILDNLLEAV